MRFVHIADLHLGKNRDAGTGWEKTTKEELYDRFLAFVDYLERNPVEFVFITGDLFDHVPKRSEIEFVDQAFARLEKTDILYVTGECDYLEKGADIYKYQFFSRFYLLDGSPFRNRVKPEEQGERTAYAEGFTDCIYFKEHNLDVYGICQFSEINARNDLDYVYAHDPRRINILLLHGGTAQVSPFSLDDLKANHFQYIALGHLHSYTAYKEANAYYPGSLEPLGPDEEGVHGFIKGYIDNSITDIKFVPFAVREYRTVTLMADNTTTDSDLEDRLEKICGKSKDQIFSVCINRSEDCYQNFTLENFRKNHRVISVKGDCFRKLDYDNMEKLNSGNVFGKNITRLRNSKSPYSEEALIEYTGFMWEKLWEEGEQKEEKDSEKFVDEKKISQAWEQMRSHFGQNKLEISGEIKKYEEDREKLEEKLLEFPDKTGDINTTWMRENDVRFEIDKLDFQDQQVNKIYKRKRLKAMLVCSMPPALLLAFLCSLGLLDVLAWGVWDMWLADVIELVVIIVSINVAVYFLYNRGKKLRKIFFGVKSPEELHLEYGKEIHALEQKLQDIFSERTRYELDQRKHKVLKQELAGLEEKIQNAKKQYEIVSLILSER